jgi:hypothetical protein
MDLMKWFIAALSVIALLFSAYAVYVTRRMEAASKPHIRLIEVRMLDHKHASVAGRNCAPETSANRRSSAVTCWPPVERQP